MSGKRSLKVAFPVASVWFGALVGPSMISGAFAAAYFAPYGPWGIILPMVSMGLASFIIAMGAEFVRKHKVYDYSSFANKLYGKFKFILTPILEVFMILAMIVGGSAVIAMGSVFFQELFGIPLLAGAAVMSIISIVLVLWGAELVRKSSTVMSVVMIVGMLSLSAFAIANNPQGLADVFSSDSIYGQVSLGAGFIGAISLGFSNACNVFTLCAVEQNITEKKDSITLGIVSFIMNSSAFIISTLMLLPYCPEILEESVPTIAIVNNYLTSFADWLSPVYMVTMLLALTSSGAPQLHAVASRVIGLYPNKGIWKTDLGRNITTGIIYFSICTALSLLGLNTIISQGYSMLGFLAIPLIALPVCIIVPILEAKKSKNIKENKNHDFI